MTLNPPLWESHMVRFVIVPLMPDRVWVTREPGTRRSSPRDLRVRAGGSAIGHRDAPRDHGADEKPRDLDRAPGLILAGC